MCRLTQFIFTAFAVFTGFCMPHFASAQASNPVLWTDVPDPDVIRVGDTYYMSSTTMHFNPGVPIMKSKDMVSWETVRYVYDVLSDQDETNLNAGKSMYGKGSWASCLRFANEYYYLYFFSYTTGKTHVYRTKDIENGSWEANTISRGMHDLSVIFDDDGRVYALYGGTDIKIIELSADGMSIKPGATEKTIIRSAGSVAGSSWIVNGEGAHIQKIDGTYYLFLISWPNGSSRTEIVYRSSDLMSGWEGKVVLRSNGIAQGGIVSTPGGKWYGLLFRDNGAVGRIPYLTTVSWTDGWPMMSAPATLDIPASEIGLTGVLGSDDFAYSQPVQLSPIWQWNHNPDAANWSMTDRPGYFRITTSRIDQDIYSARNTLTQRTFGPTCTGVVSVDVSNMKNGDYAGLSAYQDDYGFVGVKMSGGSKSIVMLNKGEEIASVPLSQNTVYLRSDCNFTNQTDKATFYYSLDGNSWEMIGNTLSMSFKLTHFCGYRYALFNYATAEAGGYVDFDFFKTGSSIDRLFQPKSAPQVTITSPTVTDLSIAPAVVAITAEASVAEGSIAKVAFFYGEQLLHEVNDAPYAFEWAVAEAGLYTVRAVATDDAGNTAETAVQLRVNEPQSPYGGQAHPIPGRIEVEEYDLGGLYNAYFDDSEGNEGGADFRLDEDVDLEDCADTNGGYNLGWSTAGEWLEYTVNVEKAGRYELVIRASCNGDGRTIALSSNGKMLTDDIAVPNTEGWQEWAEVVVDDIVLEAGEQVVRLTIGEVDFVNINNMTFNLLESKYKPIPLVKGWNLIGCPIEGTASLEKALRSIWENVEVVKDFDGFYDKANPEAMNSLVQIRWGKGYFVKLLEDCELDWLAE